MPRAEAEPVPGTAGAPAPAGAEESGAAKPFLTFFVRDEAFALPLDAVREVIRLPDIAGVPRGPAGLLGLANLRGLVLPVADLRRLLRWDSAEPTDSTRVLVVSAGADVGLVVDRIGRLLSVTPDRVESAGEEAGGPEGAATSALIRSDGGPAVPVLDPAGLLRRNFRRRHAPQPSAPTTGLPASPHSEAARAEEGRVLVSVFSNRQEYALPIEAVEEIVPLPERFTAVPGADGRVVGVVDLRHQLLPLVSLRALLGWPEEQDRRRQVAVVRLDGAILLGLVVDRAGEILRLPASSLHPLPPLLMRGGKLEIGAICRMEEGRRLVSVLSPENLFRHDAVREAVAAGGTRDGAQGGDEETEMDGRGANAEARETEEFVVFRLAGEEYGVPIAEVDEVVRLDGLTRVPKAPDFLEGIMNLRGAVLPVVDQRRRFALLPQARTGRERVMVHTVGGLRAGFIVDSIAQVLRVPSTAVGVVPELSQAEVPLVARVVNLPEAGRLLPVLDTARLLDPDEMGELADLAASG